MKHIQEIPTQRLQAMAEEYEAQRKAQHLCEVCGIGIARRVRVGGKWHWYCYRCWRG